MDSLAGLARTQKTLKGALAKLPDNIMGVYAEILESWINSQDNDDRVFAFHIFGWIAFARHPFTMLELQHALSVDLDSDIMAFEPDNLCSEDLLGSVCGGLVIAVRSGGCGLQELYRTYTLVLCCRTRVYTGCKNVIAV